jgi:hypothetical protein
MQFKSNDASVVSSMNIYSITYTVIRYSKIVMKSSGNPKSCRHAYFVHNTGRDLSLPSPSRARLLHFGLRRFLC